MSIFRKETEEETKENKIHSLKHKLRKLIPRYHRSMDHLDCGANLAAVICRETGSLALQINSLLDELAELDPNLPKDRYPTGS